MHLMNILIKIFNRKKYLKNIVYYNFFFYKMTRFFFKINKHDKQIPNYIFNDIVLNTHKS